MSSLSLCRLRKAPGTNGCVSRHRTAWQPAPLAIGKSKQAMHTALGTPRVVVVLEGGKVDTTPLGQPLSVFLSGGVDGPTPSHHRAFPLLTATVAAFHDGPTNLTDTPRSIRNDRYRVCPSVLSITVNSTLTQHSGSFTPETLGRFRGGTRLVFHGRHAS